MILSYKLSKIKSHYIIECFVNKQLAGQIKFELFKTTNLLFTEDQQDAKNIIDDYIQQKSFIYLTYIVVEDKFKGQGIANKLMTKFLNYKKVIKFPIVIYACPFPYGKKKYLKTEVLEKFYNKFGFQIIYKFPDTTLMIRN